MPDQVRVRVSSGLGPVVGTCRERLERCVVSVRLEACVGARDGERLVEALDDRTDAASIAAGLGISLIIIGGCWRFVGL